MVFSDFLQLTDREEFSRENVIKTISPYVHTSWCWHIAKDSYELEEEEEEEEEEWI